MKGFLLPVLTIPLLIGAPDAEAGVLEDGRESFKLVLDDIYAEMGSPVMTEQVAEKMDRALFLRDMDRQPALSSKVATSWGAYKNTLTAMISVEIDGQLQRSRVIWHPGRPLEEIDPDAVLHW